MLLLCFLFLLLGLVVAESDDDLLSFVTLPNVKAPRFDVSYYHRDLVSPGYWFVAPYGVIHPETPTQRWEPCQVGPHIFDGDGILIWAGSCMFDNRNIFDFRAANNIDDDYHLSFILQHAYEDDGSEKGFGYILDGRYEKESVAPVTNDVSAFNIHEFKVLDSGKTALACAYRSDYMDLGDLGRPDEYGWVMSGGFVEMDTATGEVLFEWMSPGHTPIHESVKVQRWDAPALKPAWDYIHVNSVDKNQAGDYLLSARFSSTVYLISGRTGEIIWRLGGKYSDFNQDFIFSKQHHAQFFESNDTHITVSLLNNASDESSSQEDTSSALYVQVDMSSMTARAVNRYNWPDGSLTRLRGSVQTLPNGNVFAGWSERGYHSEHSPDGRLLMQASFASSRFSSYRSYKYPFRSRPNTLPDLLASVYGTDKTDLTTVIHVSWNGATDIAAWNFYSQIDAGDIPTLIGSTNKTDFETMYIADGYLDWVSAEALDVSGNPLGGSKAQRSTVPHSWKAVGFKDSEAPTPDDPSALYSSKNKTPELEPENPYSKANNTAKAVYKAHEVIRGVGGLLLFVLVICSVGAAVAGIYWALRRRRVQSYSEIPF